MKTDQFDDAIKKKLEGIQPTFQEEDWEKFNAFANAHKVPYWKIIVSKQVMYSAAAITIVGLLFVTLTQYYAKKDLQQEVITLTQQRDSLMLNKEQLAARLDSQKQSIAQLYQQLDNKKLIDVDKKQGLDSRQDGLVGALPGRDIAISPNLKASVDNENVDFATGNWGVAKNTKRQAHTAFANVGKKETGSRRANRNSGMADANNGGGTGINQELYAMSQSNSGNSAAPIIWKHLKAHGWVIDSTQIALSGITKTDFSYYEPQDSTEKKMRFSLADAYLRVGATGMLAPQQLGGGIQAELFLDKRLSISAGLQYVNVGNEKYNTDEHFKMRNDFDFRVRFAPKVPFGAPIKNIEEQRTLWQVPIRISYYLPLPSEFYVLGKIGTDLDIAGTKKVCFDFKDKNVYQTVDNVSSKLDTKLFNNYMISVGVEKRFNHFAVQVAPTYSFQQTRVDYRKEYGLGGELKLNYTF